MTIIFPSASAVTCPFLSNIPSLAFGSPSKVAFITPTYVVPVFLFGYLANIVSHQAFRLF